MGGYIGATAVGLVTTAADVDGDANIEGNLTVKGTTITVDSATAQTVDLGDNDKIRLGDGDDLQIYHDGSNSLITDTGTGNLTLTGSSEVTIENAARSQYMLRATDGGDVKLFHNGSEKLATTSSGVDISGGLVCSPNTAGKDTFQLSTNAVDEGRLRIKNVDTTTVQIRAGGDSYFNGGNVGIGTTTIGQKLTVDGNIQLGTSSGAGKLYLASSSGFSPRLEEASNALTIYTNNVQRMRLAASGNISFHGITGRATGSTGHLSISDQSNNRSYLESATTTTSSITLMAFINPNGTVGSIVVGGSATSYNTSSDYRLKENVVNLTGATERLKQLEPKRFNFIADADTIVDGFLAHEVQDIVPEAITGTHNEVEVWTDGEELPDGVSVGDNKLDDDGNTIPKYQGIDQSKLVPLLTAALQEAITKIETLETKVTALEGA